MKIQALKGFSYERFHKRFEDKPVNKPVIVWKQCGCPEPKKFSKFV